MPIEYIMVDKSGLKSLRGIISYEEAQKSLEELKELDRRREENIEKISKSRI